MQRVDKGPLPAYRKGKYCARIEDPYLPKEKCKIVDPDLPMRN